MTSKVPVLVIGGAGYIGSHMVLLLKDAGWTVVVIDNLVPGFAFSVACEVRDYIHECDLANVHVLALEALIDQLQRSLRMHYGFGQEFSVLHVLDAVDRVPNRTIERRRSGDPDA